jgi:hypothetical protein
MIPLYWIAWRRAVDWQAPLDRLGTYEPQLALLRCHDVNATWHLGNLFAVTFRAPYLRCVVLGNGFGALE